MEDWSVFWIMKFARIEYLSRASVWWGIFVGNWNFYTQTHTHNSPCLKTAEWNTKRSMVRKNLVNHLTWKIQTVGISKCVVANWAENENSNKAGLDGVVMFRARLIYCPLQLPCFSMPTSMKDTKHGGPRWQKENIRNNSNQHYKFSHRNCPFLCNNTMRIAVFLHLGKTSPPPTQYDVTPGGLISHFYLFPSSPFQF